MPSSVLLYQLNHELHLLLLSHHLAIKLLFLELQLLTLKRQHRAILLQLLLQQIAILRNLVTLYFNLLLENLELALFRGIRRSLA